MRLIWVSVVLSFMCIELPAWAEDWTLSNGTVYKGVTVLHHDAGFVTILDEDGGATVPLRLLPTDLQKRFGYDPIAAALAEEAAHQAAVKEHQAEVAAEHARAQQPAALPPTQAPAAIQTSLVTPVPAAALSAQAGRPALSDVERQQIQNQIAILRDDIAHMERELNSGDIERRNNRYTTGGFEDKVADDKRQIQHLQAELDGTAQPGETTSGGGISDAFSDVPRL